MFNLDIKYAQFDNETKNFPDFQLNVFEGSSSIELTLSTLFEEELYYSKYNITYLKAITDEIMSNIIKHLQQDINIAIGKKLAEKYN